MKPLSFLFGITLLVTSCQKKDGPAKEADSNKLNDIVSQAYINEAKELGFNVYTGNNPPNILGSYLLAPWRFDGDNYSEPGTGTTPGSVITEGFTLGLMTDQNGDNLIVRYTGYYEGEKELSKPLSLDQVTISPSAVI